MTKYHLYQAEYRYEIDGHICQICGEYLNKLGSGLAHCISKSKINLKKYGEKIVNHRHNLIPACMKHNHLFLIDNKPFKKAKLVKLIMRHGHERLTSKEICDIIGIKYE